MKLKKYTDGKREIMATERAFEVIYKGQGFEEFVEETNGEGSNQEDKQLEDMTVKELKEKCEELGLTDYKNLKKEELIKLIENK